MTQRILLPGDKACTYAKQLKAVINSTDLSPAQKQTITKALDIVISRYCP
jgi:hypothetical protein